jgi:hypothetical protein
MINNNTGMEDMVLPVPLAFDCTSSKLAFYKPAVV